MDKLTYVKKTLHFLMGIFSSSMNNSPFDDISPFGDRSFGGINFREDDEPLPTLPTHKKFSDLQKVYEVLQKGEATYGDYLEPCASRNAENKRYHGWL